MTKLNEPHRDETRDDALDAHRGTQRDGVTAGVAARLRARGVVLTDSETGQDLVALLEAVERFERAVEARGGDLMVDEGPGGRTSEPDDPTFVLPRRAARESVPDYVARVDRAVGALRRAGRRHG